MPESISYDVIIIGSGAGGGTLAHRLAPSGKRILILERGDWLPREVQNWDATAVFVDNRYVSTGTRYDRDGTSFQPQIHYNVGGATKLYGADLYRLREKDFGELEHLHPFHAPAGIMLDEANMAYGRCIRCATCDGFPCLVHAKSDAEVVAVRPALEHPNVTLVRGAEVVKLDTDPTGRTVTEVVAMVDGARHRFSGSIVIVSAGAANSAKLLLRSATDKHPNRLANASDQVGRNYVFHNSRAFLAVSTEKNDTRFQKTLGVNDFYFGDDDFTYPMGNIQMVGKSSARPENRVSLAADGTITLTYTPNNTKPLDELYHRIKSRLNHLGLNPHHLIPRTAYMKNDIPIAGVAHLPVRQRSGRLGVGHRLQDPRTGQSLRRGHQLLPVDRRGEPGADRGGERAAGGRPPAGPAGLTPMGGGGGMPGGGNLSGTGTGGAVLVYAAGLVQGLALVCFPAASSILTSPTGYDLSASQYGLMFAPQVVLAITAAAHTPAAAVLAYAAAGLACSAMLPLSVSFAGREFPRLGATSSGELIAGYQVGYCITAFGVAPLMAATGLAMSGVYLTGAAVAVALAFVALVIARTPTLRRAASVTHTASSDVPERS